MATPLMLAALWWGVGLFTMFQGAPFAEYNPYIQDGMLWLIIDYVWRGK